MHDYLKSFGILTNLHYLPVHLHPYYKNNLGTKEGLCLVAERIYKRIITLPIFPTMTEGDIEDVIEIIRKVVNYCIF